MTAEEALLAAREHFEQRYPEYDWEKPCQDLLKMLEENNE